MHDVALNKQGYFINLQKEIYENNFLDNYADTKNMAATNAIS